VNTGVQYLKKRILSREFPAQPAVTILYSLLRWSGRKAGRPLLTFPFHHTGMVE
jgi:hypothetical protein